MKCTTKGWMLCVQWKDKSTSCEKLSDMKELQNMPQLLASKMNTPLLGGPNLCCRNDNRLLLQLTGGTTRQPTNLVSMS